MILHLTIVVTSIPMTLVSVLFRTIYMIIMATSIKSQKSRGAAAQGKRDRDKILNHVKSEVFGTCLHAFTRFVASKTAKLFLVQIVQSRVVG